MVEIIGTPLLAKTPINIPLRASFIYFIGNGIIIMWKLLTKVILFRSFSHKYSKIITLQLHITEIFRF